MKALKNLGDKILHCKRPGEIVQVQDSILFQSKQNDNEEIYLLNNTKIFLETPRLIRT